MGGVIGWLQLPPLYLTQEHDFERTSKGHEMGLIAGAHSPSPNHYFLFFCVEYKEEEATPKGIFSSPGLVADCFKRPHFSISAYCR